MRRDNPAWGLQAQGRQAGHVLSSGSQTWTSVGSRPLLPPPHHLGLKEVNASVPSSKAALGIKKVCDCWGLLAGLYTGKRTKYIGEV